MRQIALISLTALGFVLAAQASAQTGGGASGGSAPAQPDPRRTPTQADRQAVSPAYYINHGDYASAAAIQGAMQDGRESVHSGSEIGQWESVIRAYNPDTSLSNDGLRVLIESNRSGSPAGRPGEPGTRPVSNYEREQTALLQQRSQTLGSLLSAANELVELTGNAAPAAQQAAIRLRDVIREHDNNLQSILQTTRAYDGRSFPNDAAAENYLLWRSIETASVQQTGGPTDFAAQLQAQLNAVASGGVQGGRYVLDPALRNNPNASGAEYVQHVLDTVDVQAATQRHAAEQFQIEAIAGSVRRPEGQNTDIASLSLLARQSANRFGDTSLQRHSGEMADAGSAARQAANDAARGGNSGTPANGRNELGNAGVAAADAARQAGAAAGQSTGSRSGELGAAGSAAGRAAGSLGAANAGSGSAAQTAEDNTPPRPVPNSPDYPTVSQAERDRIAREAAQRRDAQQATARAEAEAAALAAQIAAQRAQEAAAQREAARLADERARLAAAAQARNAQDQRWRDMVDASFRTFQSPGWGAFDDLDPLQRGALYDAVWEAFERNGGSLTTLELEAIYENYNPLNSIPPAQSLSSAPRSLSSAGHSLSAAGTPVRSGTDDYEDPAVQSLYEVLYGLTGRRRGPLGPSEDEVQTANMGDYDLYSDPTGRWGRETGGYLAANLFDNEVDYLRRSVVNGRGGLSALLAQPFNVILTWGQGAYDLDLHMTGPTGLGATDRFHIYYSAPGSLNSFPFAALIKDCICSAGSEVILTSNLLGGGVYRVSVFNFGDPSANSTNLSNQSQATIQIVRGGVAVSQGNGTTIQGGRVILTTTVPNGQFGNTWVGVELDPRTGRITVPRTIVQSQDSANVR